MFGAIFDFDGVLVHSERHHEQCWEQIAREDQRPFSREKFLQGFGVKNELFISQILGWTTNVAEINAIIERKVALYRKLIEKDPPPLIPGTVLCVVRLRMAHIPCAIGSSSPQKDLDLVLRNYPTLAAQFAEIVSGDDVTIGKPDPAVFLEAAKRLKISPDTCVVFEDALAGVEAGIRAGMRVVALTTTFPAATLQELHPHCVVESLATFDEQKLFQLFS
jgi:HAD superfamily hydrolase (TIGR01509 family)